VSEQITEEQRDRLNSIRLEVKSMYEDEDLPEDLHELLGDISAQLRAWTTR
jgi:hypothetical protein